MTQEEARRFALSLPEAHEHSHFGRPDLRVRDKIFATLPEDGRSVNLKTTPASLDELVSMAPETFRDVWGSRWVGVDLATIEPDLLRELIIEAWRLAATLEVAD